MEDRFIEVSNYVKKIKRKFEPERVILFGSYAYGKAGKDSDVDLLVVMETELRSVEQAILIRKELPSSFPLDLIVKKPKEVKNRIKKGDFFLKSILEKGKEL
ncbi:nucleotidyltransferase domain protein [archaeon]|nr:nucleotidyltransferase domain protein [archaeon]